MLGQRVHWLKHFMCSVISFRALVVFCMVVSVLLAPSMLKCLRRVVS